MAGEAESSEDHGRGSEGRTGRVREVALVFLRLGTIAFGGRRLISR
jgi:hypothetical protein